MYAGELDASHPYVCPLNAAFEGLAPMTIFSGTLDLFYPDCVDMAAKARAAGVPVELHLRKGQPHKSQRRRRAANSEAGTGRLYR
jgi:epsilon-lactone hydrolase